MSSIKMNYHCPFKGENFNNNRCNYCSKRPTDLYIIADGIVCSYCEKYAIKISAINSYKRYVKLETPVKELELYLNAVEDYINEIN